MEQKKLTKLMTWIILPMVTFGGMLTVLGAYMDLKMPVGQYYTNIPSLVGAGLFFGGIAIFMAFNFFHNRRNGKVQDS